MSISMYEASIPHFIRMLGNLSSILDKASAHAQTKNIEEAVLINARLALDMYPLSQQIQIVTYMAEACAARLAGLEIPRYGNSEMTFADFKARIAQAIAYLQAIDSEQVDQSYDQPVTIKMDDRDVVYTGPSVSVGRDHPPFLFPCHHGLRHPQAPWRWAREKGLHRQ